jgi:hypothetical protein
MAYVNEEVAKWLAEVQPGDEAAIPQHWGIPNIYTVTRVTEASVFIGSRRFRRDDGREVGSSSSIYGRPRIVPVTDEIREEIRRDKAVRELKDIVERKLDGSVTTDAIEEAIDCLTAAAPAS